MTVPASRSMGDLMAVLRAGEMPGEFRGDPGALVSGICYDSRKVSPGDLFVCIRGFKADGHDYARQAVDRGAAAILAERMPEGLGMDGGPPVPVGLVGDTRKALGLVADEFYGRPSQTMNIVGVTGTNGKTTTTFLIKSVLEHAGYKVGLIGTITNMVESEVIPSQRTTPESADLHRLLYDMKQRGVTHVVMEVSSHGIQLSRIAGVRFNVGVFTNITQDHLDFHSSFEEYLDTKARLFGEFIDRRKRPSCAVINYDDPHHSRISNAARDIDTIYYGLVTGQPSGESVEYGFKRGVWGIPGALDSAGARMKVFSRGLEPELNLELNLSLTGRFNMYNSLAACGACAAFGIDPDTIKKGLESVQGVPGRFEAVRKGQDFAVIVDYAHTPDGLENVLKAARAITRGSLTVVFGCGGDRDKTKRPIMGEIASRLADRVIITSDNPRTEDPVEICRQVEAGVDRESIVSGKCITIVDRREAVEAAILAAGAGDTVLIAGKGHETYQIFRDRTIHFDDREEAEKVLEKIGG